MNGSHELEIDDAPVDHELFGQSDSDEYDLVSFGNMLKNNSEGDEFQISSESDYQHGFDPEADSFGSEELFIDGEADYQVIGKDTRKRIVNTRRIPWRHIVKIELSGGGGGTGTLIAPNKVLTAAHVVYDRRKRKRYSLRRVIPGKNGRGISKRTEPFGSAKAIRVNFPSAYVTPNYRDAWANDYAVITLERSFSTRVGAWSNVRSVPASQLTRLRLNTSGYPGGSKGGQHQYWTRNRVVSVRGPRIEYLLDTYAGQSGSPVWLRTRGQRTIVAIHTAKDDAGTPGATPIIANRGVAITPAILRQIKSWVRS